jgi:hypothetical protein
LTGNGRLAARLPGRADHVAKYAASLVDLLEIDLLDEIEAEFVTHDLACDKDDRGAVSISLEYSIDELQATGATASGRGRQVCRFVDFCGLSILPQYRPSRLKLGFCEGAAKSMGFDQTRAGKACTNVIGPKSRHPELFG